MTQPGPAGTAMIDALIARGKVACRDIDLCPDTNRKHESDGDRCPERNRTSECDVDMCPDMNRKRRNNVDWCADYNRTIKRWRY